MPSIFSPPSSNRNPTVLPETRGPARRLFRHYDPRPAGLSVVGPYPTYTTVETPDQLLLTGLREGVDYFLGGHLYVVSDAVAAALQASGYGASLSTVEWNELAGTGWGSLNTWERPI